MRLRELISDIYDGDVDNSFMDLDINSISCDSRTVQKESLFIALKGLTHDGTEFLDEVIHKGIRVIATIKGIQDSHAEKRICYLAVEDTHQFLREVVRRFYGNP